MSHEIERRIRQAEEGKRDLQQDYRNACEAVRRTHRAFQAGRGRKGEMPSNSLQDAYARALHELDVATRCFQIEQAA